MLDNLPIALGKRSSTSDVGWEVITPNRLKLGRNNCRSLEGPVWLSDKCTPQTLLDHNRKIQTLWFDLFTSRLHHLIPKPTQVSQDRVPGEGDVVLFLHLETPGSRRTDRWKLGVVTSLSDNGCRATIRYRDKEDKKNGEFRTCERSLRDLSIIADQSDGGLYPTSS